MEAQINIRKHKKKNKKPLWMLLGLFGAFSLFFVILAFSGGKDYKEDLEASYTIDNVKEVWNKYNVKYRLDKDFVFDIRTKLQSFNPNEEQIKECIQWLPPAPVSLNIIVVPDLSNRIIDSVNNPQQITTDKALLEGIWQTFYKETRFKKNTNDKLVIDVTDDGQAKGEFRSFADSLTFDLSKSKKEQISKLYLDKKAKTYITYIDKLYALAKSNPLGANYWDYFETSLSRHIQKSDLFNDYKNIVILITDGYLEPPSKEKTGRWDYTGSYKQRKALCEHDAMNYKNYKNYINPIEDCSTHFPNLSVMVVEVSTRKKGSMIEKADYGTPCDYRILKNQWQNWLILLEIKNADSDFFIRRSQDNQSTKQTIQKFISSP